MTKKSFGVELGFTAEFDYTNGCRLIEGVFGTVVEASDAKKALANAGVQLHADIHNASRINLTSISVKDA